MPYFMTLEDENGCLMSVPELFDERDEVIDFIKGNRTEALAGCDYYIYWSSSGGVTLDKF